jgi:hypothetical protein
MANQAFFMVILLFPFSKMWSKNPAGGFFACAEHATKEAI